MGWEGHNELMEISDNNILNENENQYYEFEFREVFVSHSSVVCRLRIDICSGDVYEYNELDNTWSYYSLSSASEVEATVEYIKFGGYEWQILSVGNNKALVITKNIVIKLAFNNQYAVTPWANSDLRKYLNSEFFNKLSDSERANIQTHNGDSIFVFNLEEAEEYFSDDSSRIADYNGEDSWWWLRLPGEDNVSSGYVDTNGRIHESADDGDAASGHFVTDNDGGVRPACWISYPQQ